jgi:iron complex outermembrane receptor protein
MQSRCTSAGSAVARSLHGRRSRALVPWVLTATALGTSVWAQSPPPSNPNDDSTLAEVIVTAQFRRENLQDTPLAITAVTGEQLEEQGLANVTDLGLVIPNANIRPQGSFSGPTPAIGMRGVMTTDFIFTSDPGVGVYIDDVYHGSLTGSAIDLLDLERVEVLRGPQGTLFGKNSLGGAIRLISRQPQGDNTGAIELTYGSSDRLDARGIYDLGVTEKLFVRLTGVSKRIDGYQDVLDFACQMRVNGTPELAGTFPTSVSPEREQRGDCRIDERGGSETDAGRVMLRYLPSEALELNFSADYLETVSEPQVDSKLSRHQSSNVLNNAYSENVVFPRYGVRFTADDRFLTGDPFKTYANPIDPIQGKVFPVDQFITVWGTTGKLDFSFTDNLRLSMIAAYRTYDIDWMGDGDQMPIDLNHTYVLQSHTQRSYEARLSGLAMNSRLQWTAGLYRYDANSHLGGYVTLPAFNSILPDFNQNDSFGTESDSVFLHGIFPITDAFSITAGARYTHEEKTYAFDHNPYLIIQDPLNYGSSHFDWKFSADYRFSPAVMVYGSVATGFRSDGAQPRPFTPGQQRIPVPAEELMAYEIGLKTDLFDRRLRLNVAAFMDDYDPRIFSSGATQCNAADNPDPGPVFRGITGGNPCPAGTALAGTTGIPWFAYDSAPGEDRGIEVELTATPVANLAINASMAWFDFKSKVSPTQANGTPNPGYVHPSYDVQAEFSGSFGAQYRFTLGSGSLTPRIDYFFQGSRSNGDQYLQQLPGSANKVPGYSLVNARITYAAEDGKWNLALAAENLFDRFYWYTIAPERSTLTGLPFDNRTGSPGRGREWSLSFRRNFR